MISFKKKEEANHNQFLSPDSTVYSEYHFSIKERILWFIVGFIGTYIVGYIFYEHLLLSFIVGVLGGFIFLPVRKKQIIEKRKKTLQRQFKEMLDSLSTSIGAGKNITDAFSNALEDMRLQFSDKAYITIELDQIVHGLDNNIVIEDLLYDFEQRAQIQDITDFSDVFRTCNQKGGNIKQIIDKTVKVIHEKIEIEMDIETMVTSKKTEQNALMVMPLVFISILKSMGGGMIDLNSPIGVVASTLSLIIFTISYFVSKKILNIKL